MRQPIIFNRHLYVDYTIEGTKTDALRDDYALCDWKGFDVKPFVLELPVEDLQVIRDRQARQETERMAGSGIAEAMKKLMSQN